MARGGEGGWVVFVVRVGIDKSEASRGVTS